MLPFFLLGQKGVWWVLSCFFGIWCQKISSGLIMYSRDWKWSLKLGYGIWDWKPTMEVWSGDSWWQFLGFRILLIWLWFSVYQLLNCHEIFVPTWSLVPFATIFFCFFFLCQNWLYGENSLWQELCLESEYHDHDHVRITPLIQMLQRCWKGRPGCLSHCGG
jgi:hypothetical protein